MTTRMIASFVLIMVVLAAIGCGRSPARGVLNDGAAAYDRGNLDEAIAYYDLAIQLDPNSAVAYYSRGLAYDKQGDLPPIAWTGS